MVQDSMPARLIERGTEGIGASYVLNRTTTTLGRDQDNDIVVTGQFISHRHAEVQWDGDRYVLVDLSRNGTFLNGARVKSPQLLHNGDIIVLPGNPSLTLVVEMSRTTATWIPEAMGPFGGSVAPIRVDTDRAEVWVRRERVHLRPKEYRALALLIEKGAVVVTKEALAARVWPEHNGAVSDDDIAQLISGLRRKLEADPDHPRHLVTVRGVGYRLDVNEPA